MEHYESSVAIDAPPERVWEALLDGAAYPSWDSGVARVEGSVTEVAIDRPGGAMTWSGGMPLGLCRGVRTFTVRPDGDVTSFSMHEAFSGPLLGMISKKVPDLQPSFDRFTSGLEARAEAR